MIENNNQHWEKLEFLNELHGELKEELKDLFEAEAKLND